MNQRSIDERAAIVEKRKRLGEWEVDTIIGKGHKQAVVSIVDRTARVTVLAKVKTEHAVTVSQSDYQSARSPRATDSHING